MFLGTFPVHLRAKSEGARSSALRRRRVPSPRSAGMKERMPRECASSPRWPWLLTALRGATEMLLDASTTDARPTRRCATVALRTFSRPWMAARPTSSQRDSTVGDSNPTAAETSTADSEARGDSAATESGVSDSGAPDSSLPWTRPSLARQGRTLAARSHCASAGLNCGDWDDGVRGDHRLRRVQRPERDAVRRRVLRSARGLAAPPGRDAARRRAQGKASPAARRGTAAVSFCPAAPATLPFTCGGGGIAGECGHACDGGCCASCSDLGSSCGPVAPGDGGIASCGSCTAPGDMWRRGRARTMRCRCLPQRWRPWLLPFPLRGPRADHCGRAGTTAAAGCSSCGSLRAGPELRRRWGGRGVRRCLLAVVEDSPGPALRLPGTCQAVGPRPLPGRRRGWPRQSTRPPSRRGRRGLGRLRSRRPRARPRRGRRRCRRTTWPCTCRRTERS